MAQETVALPVYEVTSVKEIGYEPISAVSATKFSMPLSALPLNVNVVTQEMLLDINLERPSDALQYNATSGSAVFQVRGFAAGRNLMDGYRFAGESFFTQRIEVLKGPAAVLYGRSSPGGTVNFVRKRPTPQRTFAEFRLGTGTDGRRHADFDVNGSAGFVNYRLMALWGEYEGSREGFLENGASPKTIVFPSLAFDLTKNTRLTVSYEHTERDILSQVGNHSALGISVPGPNSAQTPLFMVYNLPKNMDFGWGRRFSSDNNNRTIELDHRARRWFFHAGYNLYRAWTGDNPGISNGYTLVNNVPIVRQTFSKQEQDQRFPDFQAYALYEFSAWGADHKIYGGYSYNAEKSRTYRYSARDASTGSTTMRRDIAFLTEPVPRAVPSNLAFVPNGLPAIAKIDFDMGYLNYFGSLLENRLNVMAGISHGQGQVEEGTEGLPATFAKTDMKDTSPQVGALYKVTPSLSAFALWSRSFEIPRRRDGFNRLLSKPEQGTGYELGFKGTVLDGKVDATVAYYVTQNDNVVVNNPNGLTQAYVDSVAAGSPNESLRGAFEQIGSVETKGIEVEALFRPFASVQSRLSYAYSQAEITKDPVPARIGQQPGQYPAHKVALLSKYTFRQGSLKGLSVWNGLVWWSKEKEQIVAGKQLYTREHFHADGGASYTTKLLGVDTEFRLTVRDIFLNKNSSRGFNPATMERYWYTTPRQIWFDVSLRF